jgi:hypothetical protein
MRTEAEGYGMPPSAQRRREGGGDADAPTGQGWRADRSAPPDTERDRHRKRGDGHSTRGTLMEHRRQGSRGHVARALQPAAEEGR